MSTSDQQGDRPLTRKQLREIRLTGSTPVIGEDEAAAASAKQTSQPPAAPLPRAAAPVELPPVPDTEEPGDAAAPLTRRQARARERSRTASADVSEEPQESAEEEGAAEATPEDTAEDDVVSSVPAFAPVSAQPAVETDTAAAFDVHEDSDEFSTVLGVSSAETDEDDSDAEGLGDEVAEAVVTGERPIVSPKLGTQLLSGESDVPDFAPSFDELITSDSGGSHRAPNTLIFTHPGEGSLSGPVASTGELLITGSYELPRGLGSQGHAHGTTDGRDVDAVLIDGELPPASSPTPIAASSAVSTIKPAGEVIRPPAPEKGNKLMLTLAITAGGLALALAVALVVAFTTNVLG